MGAFQHFFCQEQTDRSVQRALAFKYCATKCFTICFVGKYALNLGLQDSNLDSCTNEELDLNVETIGDAMQAEGYTTHMIGKFSLRFPRLKVAIHKS